LFTATKLSVSCSDIPSQELTNTFADAEAIWSKEIRRVSERLNSTDALPEMITLGKGQ
jgi:hypothetical protein